MIQIFISYSRKDLEFVDRLANDLQTTGFEVWYDLSGLEGGTRWSTEIQNAIQESQFFLVVLSPNSIKSNWVEREFLEASDQGLKIIPILYQSCKLPMWSLNLHFIDMQGKNYALHFQELLKILGAATQVEEENPIAVHYIEIGDVYRKRGQPDLAIQSYLQALQADPGSLKAQTNIGTVHLAEQSYAQAAEAFEKALQLSGENLVARAGWCEANLALGNQARADGRIEESAGYYREILRIVPGDTDALQNLASIYTTRAEDLLRTGQEEEALAAYSEAVKYSPGDQALLSRLGKIQAEKNARVLNELVARSENEISAGNWDKAAAILNEALQVAPQEGAILRKIEGLKQQRLQKQLEDILSKVNESEKAAHWDAALTGLNEYLQLKPDDKVIQKRLADLMESKHAAWLGTVTLRVDQALANHDWQSALNALDEALKLEPDNTELKARVDQVKKDQHAVKLNAIILRAEQAAAAGRWDDSIETLNNGLLSDPDNAALKTKLADTLQARRKLQLDSVLHTADVDARAGRWESAISALNVVLANEPDNAEFLEKYSLVLKLEHETKLKTMQSQAKNLVKAEKFQEALAALNEILVFAPETRQVVLDEIEAVTRAQKLETHYSEGKQAYAEKEYERAVDLFAQVLQERTGYKDAANLLVKSRRLLAAAQKQPFPARRRTWLVGGFLALLVLGIGGGILWFGKNGLQTVFAPKTENSNPTLNNLVFLPTQSSQQELSQTPQQDTPQGETITVTTSSNQARGSLRQAIVDAQPGDTILFDPEVFPPNDPVTIYITEPLRINTDSITIDASNAGVILDGSSLPEPSFGMIIDSNYNVIMGLKITNTKSVGIYMEGGSYNTIGGDRTVGAGPYGQGNLIVNNQGPGISFLPQCGGNKIIGNFIGTDESGSTSLGNYMAGIVFEGAQFEGDDPVYSSVANTIGPGNVIAFNGGETKAGGGLYSGGISIASVKAGVEITSNTIFDNAGKGIEYLDLSDAAEADQLTPPNILYFDLDSGLAAGHSCNGCRVEIFSTDTQDAKIYEGDVTADQFGNFIFRKDGALSGPFLTGTSRSPYKSTSEISLPTPAISNIQIALNSLQSQTPYFQTSFDTWEDTRGGVNVENGKFILSSEDPNGTTALMGSLTSDKYAIEYELSVLNADNYGYITSQNESSAGLSFVFFGNGQTTLNAGDIHGDIATGSYDPTQSNQVTLIILEDVLAAFVNGEINYITLNPDGSNVYINQRVFAQFKIVCVIDNYKIWDLSDLDLNQ